MRESSSLDSQRQRLAEKMAMSRRLEDQIYYHGRIQREDVDDLLHDNGDFILRESINTSQTQPLVLSVLWDGKPRHFPISYDYTDNKIKWRLGQVTCATVSELIAHYFKSGRIVKDQVQLITPITKDKYQLLHEDVELTYKLGEGAFGTVHAGTLKHGLGDTMEVAVKVCKDSEVMTKEEKRKFLNEARIMKRYDHPNVLALVGVCMLRDPVMIVTELMWLGLDAYFDKYRGESDVLQMTKFCVDTAAGMAYLSSRNCIHRDLAARNCLLSKEKVVKVSDFGLSREGTAYTIAATATTGLDQMAEQELAQHKLPVRWLAPEVLSHRRFTSKSDVWAFGILMYEVFTEGGLPYPEIGNNLDIVRGVMAGTLTIQPAERMPERIACIMKYALLPDPQNRPRFKEIHAKLQQEQSRLAGILVTPKQSLGGKDSKTGSS